MPTHPLARKPAGPYTRAVQNDRSRAGVICFGLLILSLGVLCVKGFAIFSHHTWAISGL